jgi:hypothetical protein
MSLRVEVFREVIGQVFVGIDVVSDSELSLTSDVFDLEPSGISCQRLWLWSPSV